ncbi:phosphatidylinositol phosphate synthase [Nesterenkonia natronophila]|uniref:Phosphatidylinositol phosphate synthase n=1 Tax=Nesterenkonia natronophila TaxID=2174932 RepID=A0A3A4F0Q8_9MICC|nr:CDP-alcohol phosphatidyltransferase family protein [Nesterenkonia natronophila]RJN31291.1 CDP-alcohol phosphatidyltransferase family protein [Nesterenkonia natronophila]
MMLRNLRSFFSAVFTPVARLLLKIGLTPNAVTLIGAAGVSLGALVLYPLGQLFWGTLVITLFVFSDLIDGLMARLGDQKSEIGGFLDSVFDRVQDSAVFLGLMLWFFGSGGDYWIGVAAGVCLILGLLVSYIRARAESLGYDANTGIAERPERMVLTLVFTGFVGLGMSQTVLLIVLVLLAAASMVTVIQRVTTVIRQAH